MAEQTEAGATRRQVLKGVGVLGGLAVVGGLGWSFASDRDPAPAGAGGGGGDATLDRLASAAVSGGPPKDGIASIDRPVFVPAGKADFLTDADRVFGLIRGGAVRAYPQRILVQHEIVNDSVAGDRIAITYCPLTGTVIGFTGTKNRRGLTFGTTGRLVNSNLLMYDRETDSEWPQVFGTAVRGELYGQRLETVPLWWTTWRSWRVAHPETSVLSTDTGAIRDYGSDPYGSYLSGSGYYAGGDPIFPVEHASDRLPPKEVVVGIRSGDARLAIRKDLIRDEWTVTATVGGTQVRAEWDDELATVRVTGPGGAEHPDYLDAMWFAWYAFYPRTEART